MALLRNPVIRLALLVLVWIPGSSQAATPSSPTDSLHWCAIFDYEQWRRDHPLPAAKGLADLVVGEPRTVRMIYFRPNDRPFRQEMVDSMKVVIRRVQTFYAEQMEAHGYGRKTFRFETDAQGEPLVHRVVGQHGVSRYADAHGPVFDEIGEVFDTGANIYLAIVDGGGGPARGGRRGKIGGTASSRAPSFEVDAHELGHAFGLLHDWRDDAYIMSYGGTRDSLSTCAAEFLSVHPYFNSEVPIEEGTPPTVELVSPRAYPVGSEGIPIQLKVGDSAGLHQVILFVGQGNATTVKSCRGMSRQTDAVAEFEYDGEIPTAYGSRSSRLSDLASHPIHLRVVNSEGDVEYADFMLSEISPHQVATLEGHRGSVWSVAFSPDGKTLATRGGDTRLWFVSARRSFATLHGVSSLSFSSRGHGTLATGSWDHTITLWDGRSGERIATLEGHTDKVTSLSFAASAGNTLASASRDGTIKLWDVETRSVTGGLHAGEVGSLSLSADGSLLASASHGDKAIKLWDVGTRELIGTLEGHRSGVTAVAFSPDGTTIASGSWDRRALLWDAETRDRIATLEGHGSKVTSVSFSFPAGSLLASGSGDGSVILWDVAAREKAAAFGHTAEIHSVSFSPVGAVLAAGGGDGKAPMWDVSEWARPRPWEVEVISGDGQQGAPGAELAQPLVVEVRDQYGDLLRDAVVTFTVTGGDGQLSGRFTVEHARTDASGRAELTLTLGLYPGTNTVGVSIGGREGGRELRTFTAKGLDSAVALLEEDYRTWHLPEGAMARLGKGDLGEGDRAATVSPDGRVLAVGTSIGVWLYEPTTSRVLALLPGSHPVHTVTFSANRTLAAGLENGQVDLWDVRTRTRVRTLGRDLGHPYEPVFSVTFSPDGAILASGSRSGTAIRLWDVETGSLVGTWEVPREIGTYVSVVFLQDGTQLATGFADGTIGLWDLTTQTEVASWRGHGSLVTSLACSPDGAILASGSWDRTVRLWDTSTLQLLDDLEAGAGGNWVSFTHDGSKLAAGDGDGRVRLWDARTRQRLDILDGRLQRHTVSLHSNKVRVAFSPDGATLVSVAADGRLLLRGLETGSVAVLSGHSSLVNTLAFSPDGATLASGWRQGTALWDMASQIQVSALEAPLGVRSVSFSPDGAILASGGWDFQDGLANDIALWDVKTRDRIGSMDAYDVSSVAFSPDGATLASGSEDGTIILWDVTTREQVAAWEGTTDNLRSLVFSPDGTMLASGGNYDYAVKLWDVRSRQLIDILEGHTDAVSAVAFSPDGTILASGGGEGGGTILWDMRTRSQITNLKGGGWVNCVAFSPDGSLLASGSWHDPGPTVRLWDVASRKRIAALDGTAGVGVTALAFSPDSATLASGSWDGTILLWDLQQLKLPRPHRLTILRRNAQQGPAGGALAEPFVVLVRDQNGADLAGVTVTFSVTAGGGTLSAEATTTDAHGRATSTLTLGSQPGPNRVEVTVAGLEPVTFTAVGLAVPRAVEKVSGDEQLGAAGSALAKFVVEVRDQNGNRMAGVRVTFGVATGGGTLSVTRSTTDAQGRAATTLTLGRTPGANSVEVAVAGLEPVTFTATAKATPDFDGDGLTGLEDFMLFAEAFGGTDPRFDLDGSGKVDFADFFLFAEAFEQPTRAKLLALARERIGLPEGPQLQPNAPNPFNSGTVISWFQLQPGPAQLEVFALTGQRVAVLHEGAEEIGLHRLHWDGRSDQGHPLASGVYVYRLVTAEGAWTRKLTLLR